MRGETFHVAIDCRKAADLGIGRYITGLTHALVRIAPEVQFTLIAHPGSASLLPQEGVSIRHTRIGHYRLHEPYAIGRIIDGIRPDVFHAPHYVYPSTRVPGIVTIHDLIHLRLLGARAALRRGYARVMIARAVRRSEAILTVSHASAAEIVKKWPQASGHIHVTPNGVDQRLFSIERSADPSFPFLLVVGNDKPHKNLDRLVEAWKQSHPQNARLVFVGSSPERFRSVAGVELRGRVTERELTDLLSRATGLISPSLEEGFGLPVLEAMAAGAPVAASDIRPVREIAGTSVILFDPLDTGDIGRAIRRLLSPDPEAGSMVRAARERAAQFTWEETARLTCEVYRSVAAEGVRKHT